MEPEQTSPAPVETTQEDKFTNLNKVTPLSKYLAMCLFVLLPFIGGWIGYTYAPEKVVEVERVVVKEVVVENTIPVEGHAELENLLPSVPPHMEQIKNDMLNEDESERNSRRVTEAEIDGISKSGESILCDHGHLKEVDSSMYGNWPVYVDDEFDISFSYPPSQKPNFEKEFSHDGDDYLLVGFNPNLTPEFIGYGKPYLHSINDTWEVEIYRETDSKKISSNEYCSWSNWCIVEKLDLNNDLNTTVYTLEDEGMLTTEERGYYVTSADGLVIEVELPAATGEFFEYEDPCAIISEIYNIDLIVHSLKLN